MLMVVVAFLLGLLGFSAVAGGVTLDALSHSVPGELWQIASAALAALAALLAGHAIGVSSASPAPVEPPTTSGPGATTINYHSGSTENASESASRVVEHLATRPVGGEPPAGLSPYDVKGGHPDLPAPPADRSRGRASPPRGTLPPRTRSQPRRTITPATKRSGTRRR